MEKGDNMEQLIFMAKLTYIAFAGAIFVVMINALVDIIYDFVSNIIAKHKAKKYEKYIKSLPDGDLRKSVYKISKAFQDGFRKGFQQGDETENKDSVDCMGR